MAKKVKAMKVNQGERITRQNLWKHRYLYMMLFPCIIFFLIFSYIPMTGMILAFREFDFNSGIWGGKWIGLKYYERFFSDSRSTQIIINTLIISGMKLFLALPFPILLALMFNEVQNSKLRAFFQGVSYIPHFLSWVVVVGIARNILAPDVGLLNQIIKLSGGDGSHFFMMDPQHFHTIMFSTYLWKDIGWSSIIYFAAIMGISPQLFEAASIDGANRFRQIIHIIIPSIFPTIIVLFILSLGNILSAGFDQIYLLQTPGNAKVAEIIDTYVIRTGIKQGDFSYATAIGLIQGVIGLILVLLVNYISSKKFKTSLW